MKKIFNKLKYFFFDAAYRRQYFFQNLSIKSFKNDIKSKIKNFFKQKKNNIFFRYFFNKKQIFFFKNRINFLKKNNIMVFLYKNLFWLNLSYNFFYNIRIFFKSKYFLLKIYFKFIYIYFFYKKNIYVKNIKFLYNIWSINFNLKIFQLFLIYNQNFWKNKKEKKNLIIFFLSYFSTHHKNYFFFYQKKNIWNIKILYKNFNLFIQKINKFQYFLFKINYFGIFLLKNTLKFKIIFQGNDSDFLQIIKFFNQTPSKKKQWNNFYGFFLIHTYFKNIDKNYKIFYKISLFLQKWHKYFFYNFYKKVRLINNYLYFSQIPINFIENYYKVLYYLKFILRDSGNIMSLNIWVLVEIIYIIQLIKRVFFLKKKNFIPKIINYFEYLKTFPKGYWFSENAYRDRWIYLNFSEKKKKNMPFFFKNFSNFFVIFSQIQLHKNNTHIIQRYFEKYKKFSRDLQFSPFLDKWSFEEINKNRNIFENYTFSSQILYYLFYKNIDNALNNFSKIPYESKFFFVSSNIKRLTKSFFFENIINFFKVYQNYHILQLFYKIKNLPYFLFEKKLINNLVKKKNNFFKISLNNSNTYFQLNIFLLLGFIIYNSYKFSKFFFIKYNFIHFYYHRQYKYLNHYVQNWTWGEFTDICEKQDYFAWYYTNLSTLSDIQIFFNILFGNYGPIYGYTNYVSKHPFLSIKIENWDAFLVINNNLNFFNNQIEKGELFFLSNKYNNILKNFSSNSRIQQYFNNLILNENQQKENLIYNNNFINKIINYLFFWKNQNNNSLNLTNSLILRSYKKEQNNITINNVNLLQKYYHKNVSLFKLHFDYEKYFNLSNNYKENWEINNFFFFNKNNKILNNLKLCFIFKKIKKKFIDLEIFYKKKKNFINFKEYENFYNFWNNKNVLYSGITFYYNYFFQKNQNFWKNNKNNYIMYYVFQNPLRFIYSFEKNIDFFFYNNNSINFLKFFELLNNEKKLNLNFLQTKLSYPLFFKKKINSNLFFFKEKIQINLNNKKINFFYFNIFKNKFNTFKIFFFKDILTYLYFFKKKKLNNFFIEKWFSFFFLEKYLKQKEYIEGMYQSLFTYDLIFKNNFNLRLQNKEIFFNSLNLLFSNKNNIKNKYIWLNNFSLIISKSLYDFNNKPIVNFYFIHKHLKNLNLLYKTQAENFMGFFFNKNNILGYNFLTKINTYKYKKKKFTKWAYIKKVYEPFLYSYRTLSPIEVNLSLLKKRKKNLLINEFFKNLKLNNSQFIYPLIKNEFKSSTIFYKSLKYNLYYLKILQYYFFIKNENIKLRKKLDQQLYLLSKQMEKHKRDMFFFAGEALFFNKLGDFNAIKKIKRHNKKLTKIDFAYLEDFIVHGMKENSLLYYLCFVVNHEVFDSVLAKGSEWVQKGYLNFKNLKSEIIFLRTDYIQTITVDLNEYFNKLWYESNSPIFLFFKQKLLKEFTGLLLSKSMHINCSFAAYIDLLKGVAQGALNKNWMDSWYVAYGPRYRARRRTFYFMLWRFLRRLSQDKLVHQINLELELQKMYWIFFKKIIKNKNLIDKKFNILEFFINNFNVDQVIKEKFIKVDLDEEEENEITYLELLYKNVLKYFPFFSSLKFLFLRKRRHQQKLIYGLDGVQLLLANKRAFAWKLNNILIKNFSIKRKFLLKFKHKFSSVYDVFFWEQFFFSPEASVDQRLYILKQLGILFDDAFIYNNYMVNKFYQQKIVHLMKQNLISMFIYTKNIIKNEPLNLISFKYNTLIKNKAPFFQIEKYFSTIFEKYWRGFYFNKINPFKMVSSLKMTNELRAPKYFYTKYQLLSPFFWNIKEKNQNNNIFLEINDNINLFRGMVRYQYWIYLQKHRRKFYWTVYRKFLVNYFNFFFFNKGEWEKYNFDSILYTNSLYFSQNLHNQFFFELKKKKREKFKNFIFKDSFFWKNPYLKYIFKKNYYKNYYNKNEIFNFEQKNINQKIMKYFFDIKKNKIFYLTIKEKLKQNYIFFLWYDLNKNINFKNKKCKKEGYIWQKNKILYNQYIAFLYKKYIINPIIFKYKKIIYVNTRTFLWNKKNLKLKYFILNDFKTINQFYYKKEKIKVKKNLEKKFFIFKFFSKFFNNLNIQKKEYIKNNKKKNIDIFFSLLKKKKIFNFFFQKQRLKKKNYNILYFQNNIKYNNKIKFYLKKNIIMKQVIFWKKKYKKRKEFNILGDFLQIKEVEDIFQIKEIIKSLEFKKKIVFKTTKYIENKINFYFNFIVKEYFFFFINKYIIIFFLFFENQK